MCAIIDANAANEVFGNALSSAGLGFRNWIDQGKGRLAAGGELLEELEKLSGFREWARNATLAGLMRIANANEVNSKAEQIRDAAICHSNDPHVVALAQVTGARLLYSNDIPLHRDFKNKNLIDNPRGKIYSTNDDKNFTRQHQRLLGTKNLCRSR